MHRFLSGREIVEYSFEDHLDDGTSLKIHITIKGGDHSPETLRAVIDFTGTDTWHREDNLNIPISVTRSAILYVLKVITGVDMPLNSGCLRPIEIIIPESTILSPQYPLPVGSGNVETSQRVVDLLLGAFRIAGASQGTMNNILFEVDGDVPYYETVAGGSGGSSGCAGASGVQVHMTNTRMTDPEILETRHNGVRLKKFTIRKGSGGRGLYPGGDGVIREIEFLRRATVSIISERRVYAPYGMQGGECGKKGKNFLKKVTGEMVLLPHRVTLHVEPGDSIIIETPGGGGYGHNPTIV